MISIFLSLFFVAFRIKGLRERLKHIIALLRCTPKTNSLILCSVSCSTAQITKQICNSLLHMAYLPICNSFESGQSDSTGEVEQI